MGGRSTLKKKLTPDEELAVELARFYDDPLGYVMFAWDWDKNETIRQVALPKEYQQRFPGCTHGPDQWACEFLDQIGEEVRKRGFDGKIAVDPLRFVTASGHGIGKSALTSWIIKWISDTRPYSKGTVTAGTADQLKTKTWAQLGYWHSMSITKHLWDYSAARGAMVLKRKDHPESWRCDAQTCKEENSESFAGQHAANSTSYYIFDEASAVPDKIFEVRDGGLTDGEPMVFDFGNPTRNSGKFFEECEGKLKHRFIVRHIDSRSVAITNKKYFAEMMADNGEDSDYFKVRCRGMFPSQGSVQFIPTADVELSGHRPMVIDRYAPLVIGVDVARFGPDDSVIYPRIGMDARSFGYKRYNGLDTNQIREKVIDVVREFAELGVACQMIFVDTTGGSIGGGVFDQLMERGYQCEGIGFGDRATEEKYRYRGDEMWGRMRDALHSRLLIPEQMTPLGLPLFDQLTQREFGYTLSGNKIHLESKADMKSRGLPSPDIGDALALTFASPVQTLSMPHGTQAKAPPQDYDPINDPLY